MKIIKFQSMQITFGIYILIFVFILLLNLSKTDNKIQENKDDYTCQNNNIDTYSNVQQIIINHNNIDYTFDFIDRNTNIKIIVDDNRMSDNSKIINIYQIHGAN